MKPVFLLVVILLSFSPVLICGLAIWRGGWRLAPIAYSVCFWRGRWRLGAMVPLLLLVPVITGVFCACVVAGHSHDWVLNQQTTNEPIDSIHEVVDSKSENDDT